MRPIKFRVYDKEAEHMVYSDKPEDSYTFGYEEGVLKAWYTEFFDGPDGTMEPRSEELEPLMQFTGLVDKNGKEIYEGDVVRHAEGFGNKPRQIMWNNFGWSVSYRDGYIDLGSIFVDDLEVIGNIYENPELLEAK